MITAVRTVVLLRLSFFVLTISSLSAATVL